MTTLVRVAMLIIAAVLVLDAVQASRGGNHCASIHVPHLEFP